MTTVEITFGLRIGGQYLSITSRDTGLVGATTRILNSVRATMNTSTDEYPLTLYCGFSLKTIKLAYDVHLQHTDEATVEITWRRLRKRPPKASTRRNDRRYRGRIIFLPSIRYTLYSPEVCRRHDYDVHRLPNHVPGRVACRRFDNRAGCHYLDYVPTFGCTQSRKISLSSRLTGSAPLPLKYETTRATRLSRMGTIDNVVDGEEQPKTLLNKIDSGRTTSNNKSVPTLPRGPSIPAYLATLSTICVKRHPHFNYYFMKYISHLQHT